MRARRQRMRFALDDLLAEPKLEYYHVDLFMELFNKLQEEAWEEGYDEGYEEGHEEALKAES